MEKQPESEKSEEPVSAIDEASLEAHDINAHNAKLPEEAINISSEAKSALNQARQILDNAWRDYHEVKRFVNLIVIKTNENDEFSDEDEKAINKKMRYLNEERLKINIKIEDCYKALQNSAAEEILADEEAIYYLRRERAIFNKTLKVIRFSYGHFAQKSKENKARQLKIKENEIRVQKMLGGYVTWNEAICKLKDKIKIICDNKDLHYIDASPASFSYYGKCEDPYSLSNIAIRLLFQSLFSGKLPFYLYTNRCHHENIDKYPMISDEEYSFEEAYKEFIKSFSKDKTIRFDTVTCQMMPYKSILHQHEYRKKYGAVHIRNADAKICNPKEQWDYYLSETVDIKAYSIFELSSLPLVYDKDEHSEVDHNASRRARNHSEHTKHTLNLSKSDTTQHTFHVENLDEQEENVINPEKMHNANKQEPGTTIKYKSVRTPLMLTSDIIRDIDRSQRHSIRYHVGHVILNDKIFPFGSSETHTCDKRFKVYFDYLNEILTKFGAENCHGNYSSLFNTFLNCNGINISLYKVDNFLNIPISNSFVHEKFNTPQCLRQNRLDNYCVFKEHDFENFLDNINKESFSEYYDKPYETFFKDSDITIPKKFIDKDNLANVNADAVTLTKWVSRLCTKLDDSEVQLCRAAIALLNPNKKGTDVKILEHIFSGEKIKVIFEIKVICEEESLSDEERIKRIRNIMESPDTTELVKEYKDLKERGKDGKKRAAWSTKIQEKIDQRAKGEI